MGVLHRLRVDEDQERKQRDGDRYLSDKDHRLHNTIVDDTFNFRRNSFA